MKLAVTLLLAYQATRAKAAECTYQTIPFPLTANVPSNDCCVSLASWSSAGSTADAAVLDAICSSPGCPEVAQAIFDAAPSFVGLVAPSCNFDCDYSPFTPTINVAGEQCCQGISTWFASGAAAHFPSSICSSDALTSDGVSCADTAQSIYNSADGPIQNALPKPICEVIVHTIDVALDICLEAVVAIQDAGAYTHGACSTIGFGTNTGTTQEIGGHFFSEWSAVAGPTYSLDHLQGQCLETTASFPGFVSGSCSDQGYSIMNREFELLGISFLLYDVGRAEGIGLEGVVSEPQVYIHKIGHNVAEKCSQIKVAVSAASFLTAALGFSSNMCSRHSYIVEAGEITVIEQGVENTYTLWELPGPPKTVNYDFSLRQWTTDFLKPTVVTPGDGYRRTGIELETDKRKSSLLFNGQYPGPLVEAIEGDTISVNITNNVLFGEVTSVHWHGMHMRGTPWADGAYMISQGPLRPLETQNYLFTADPPGTYFYHSHIAIQRERGVQGPLLIHRRNDPHRSLYDEDRIIYLSDELREPNMVCEDGDGHFPVATGPGSRTESTCRIYGPPTSVNGQVGDGSERYPYHMVPVEAGACYRLRFVYAHAISPYGKVSVSGHTFKVVSIDGQDVEPIEVDSFTLHQGGRVDIVLCANQEPGMYAITILDELTCGWVDLELTDRCAYHAFLKYDNFDGPPPMTPSSIDPGAIPGTGGGRFATVSTSTGIDLTLDSQESIALAVPLKDTSVAVEPEQTITLNWGVLSSAFPYNGPTTPMAESYRWYIDELGRKPRTFRLPSIPLMQSRGQCGFDPEETPVINIPEGTTDVEVVINNLTPFFHALHVHGMSAKVVNVGRYEWTDNVTQFFIRHNDTDGVCEDSGGYVQSGDELEKDLAGGAMWGCSYVPENHGFNNNYINPIERDTFTLPRRSWVVLRFKFDNPGIWPFHCHVADHAFGGSMALFNVMSSQIPPRPPTTPTQGMEHCTPECSTLNADTCFSYGGCAWHNNQGCTEFRECSAVQDGNVCSGFPQCEWNDASGCAAKGIADNSRRVMTETLANAEKNYLRSSS